MSAFADSQRANGGAPGRFSAGPSTRGGLDVAFGAPETGAQGPRQGCSSTRGRINKPPGRARPTPSRRGPPMPPNLSTVISARLCRASDEGRQMGGGCVFPDPGFTITLLRTYIGATDFWRANYFERDTSPLCTITSCFQNERDSIKK